MASLAFRLPTMAITFGLSAICHLLSDFPFVAFQGFHDFSVHGVHGLFRIEEDGKKRGNTILPGTYRAAAEYEGGQCEFSITFPETQDEMTDVGEILCAETEVARSAVSDKKVEPAIADKAAAPAAGKQIDTKSFYEEQEKDVRKLLNN